MSSTREVNTPACEKIGLDSWTEIFKYLSHKEIANTTIINKKMCWELKKAEGTHRINVEKKQSSDAQKRKSDPARQNGLTQAPSRPKRQGETKPIADSRKDNLFQCNRELNSDSSPENPPRKIQRLKTPSP